MGVAHRHTQTDPLPYRTPERLPPVMGGLGSALDGASRWVDEHKRAIAYGLYASIAVGGALVLRSIRVTAQFRCAKDIPDEFLKNRYSIFGEVVNAGLSQGADGKLACGWFASPTNLCKESSSFFCFPALRDSWSCH